MDWTTIIVGLLALLGTTIGSMAGIRVSNKLVDFRLAALEEKVDLHNNLVVRMATAEEKIKVANHRLDDLENGN